MSHPNAGKSEGIDSLDVAVYKIPTDHEEADGTIAWDSTGVVVVRARGAGKEGLGWSYAGGACGPVVTEQLTSAVIGRSVFDVPGANEAMVRAVRNLGRPGVSSEAISAVDTALWDLKARLLDIPLASLFGRAREEAPIYGSGGFTTYSDGLTRSQLETWTEQWQVPRVKIKIGESWGTCADRDLSRVRLARSVIGDEVELYVDANGGYTRKQAIRLGAQMCDESAVSWFEEPVSSDDLAGLREVRDQCRPDVAAGEYGYDIAYFSRMVNAEAVDCLQVDVTRCGGYTQWLRAAAVAGAVNLQVSGHCAPNLHAHVAVAIPNLRHLEYFHDHHRIENMIFDGALSPVGGVLVPSRDAPGHGLSFKEKDAEKFRLS